MKQGMTNVDVAALASELAPLVVGARVDRAYQPGRDTVLLRLRRKGVGRIDLLFELGRFVTATRRAPANPDKPSMVAQLLRTTLENARVTGFRQIGFDRLLRMDLERGDGARSLVLELFGDGNLVLLDEAGTILFPMRAGEFSARRIKKGEPYVPPPGGAMRPFAMDRHALREAAGNSRARDVVRFLALDLGFGPLWGEELCLRARVPKGTKLGEATEAQWNDVHGAIMALGRDIQRNDLAPAVVVEAGPDAVPDVVPDPVPDAVPDPVPDAVPDPVPDAMADARPGTARLPGPATDAADGAAAGAGPATAPPRAEAGPQAQGGTAAGPRPVDAVPFVMLRYPQPRFVHQEAASFREALDELFLGTETEEGEGEAADEDPRRARLEEAKGKLERQVAQMDAAIAGFLAEEAEARRDAEALYEAFAQAQGLLQDLARARATRSWAEVEEVLRVGREEGNPLALQVPRLHPHNGTATLRLQATAGVREVEVDLRASVQENADLRYAAAKRARARREGAEKARGDAMGRLADLERKGLDAFGAAPVREVRTSRHFWFESYRWTVTPGGLLAVGGRSASQNDAVVKKYLRPGDRYVHAEIHGAPSVVVRPADGATGEVAPEDLRAAAQFAVVSSRAWRQGSSGSAYWVTPEQVSKTPRSGEYVPKGAWMVHGKRNVEDGLPMRWWVGKVRFTPAGAPVPRAEWAQMPRTVEKLAGGTLEAMLRYSDGCLRLEPGVVDPADASQIVSDRFGAAIEEAQAVLPPGPVDLQEEPAHPAPRAGP